LRDDARRLGAIERRDLLTDIAAEANQLVRLVDEALAPLGTRSVTFAVDESLPSVQVDAGLLNQSLTALLEFVAAHTPAGSPLWIDGTLDGSQLRIAISDAAPGIPDADRERVFARYERHDGRGTGVCLGDGVAGPLCGHAEADSGRRMHSRSRE
jgi:K+-sensing histidine kinase KdpD